MRVASFRGKVTIDLERDFDKNEKISNKLVEAAEHAHRLTMVLRSKGVDAFEFHDRYESIVTIGSFNTVGTPRIDGKIEIDPMITHVMGLEEINKGFDLMHAGESIRSVVVF